MVLGHREWQSTWSSCRPSLRHPFRLLCHRPYEPRSGSNWLPWVRSWQRRDHPSCVQTASRRTRQAVRLPVGVMTSNVALDGATLGHPGEAGSWYCLYYVFRSQCFPVGWSAVSSRIAKAAAGRPRVGRVDTRSSGGLITFDLQPPGVEVALPDASRWIDVPCLRPHAPL